MYVWKQHLIYNIDAFYFQLQYRSFNASIRLVIRLYLRFFHVGAASLSSWAIFISVMVSSFRIIVQISKMLGWPHLTRTLIQWCQLSKLLFVRSFSVSKWFHVVLRELLVSSFMSRNRQTQWTLNSEDNYWWLQPTYFPLIPAVSKVLWRLYVQGGSRSDHLRTG